MKTSGLPRYKTILMGSAVAVAMAILPGVAHAAALYPYAYSTNQISGLLFSQNGKSVSSIPITGSETVGDTAQFGSYPISGFQKTTTTVNAPLSIGQAYAGPGPTPTATYSPVGAGNFTGARSDAVIGANSGSGSSVTNVAEAYGNALGKAAGSNNATINFTFTGAGAPLSLAFNAIVNLAASTSGASTSGMLDQSAFASAQDVFQVIESTPSGAYVTGATFDLFPGNGVNSVSSSNGSAAGTYSLDQAYTYTTPFSLVAGDLYNITLTSIANTTITPGTPVPEPGSLILLGTGLVGLGLIIKRKNAKKA